jgi:hypothetical protein
MAVPEQELTRNQPRTSQTCIVAGTHLLPAGSSYFYVAGSDVNAVMSIYFLSYFFIRLNLVIKNAACTTGSA